MLSKLRHLALLLLLATLSCVITFHATAQDKQKPPIDIILLLDSSGSTYDQRYLIEKATEFLLDYLDANVDFANLDYRLGVVAFNQDINTDSMIRLGRPSISNLKNFFESTPSRGDTDFNSPIEFALSEFGLLNSLDSDRMPIVILMTDGQPAVAGEVLSEPELDAYFTDIGNLVLDTHMAGVQLFVIAVGDAQADQARWQQILLENHYASIDNSSNLSEVYWQILSEFVGGSQDEVFQLEAGQAYDILVESYTDELTLTVLKDDPDGVIKIVNPDGYEYEKAPTRGGEDDTLHEIYLIPTPEEGNWEITH